MTVEQLSIAFIHRLPVMLAMPNKPRLKYKEILYIEYSRQKAGNKRVNAGLVDVQSPRSITVARLKYIEPCLNEYADDDGETYSFNTDCEDYANTEPLIINSEYKEAFDNISPVEVTIEAKKLSNEVQQRLIGCVMNGKTLKLKFPYIQRLKIYLDQNREPILFADFDLGVDIPVEDVNVISLKEYYQNNINAGKEYGNSI